MSFKIAKDKIQLMFALYEVARVCKFRRIKYEIRERVVLSVRLMRSFITVPVIKHSDAVI